MCYSCLSVPWLFCTHYWPIWSNAVGISEGPLCWLLVIVVWACSLWLDNIWKCLDLDQVLACLLTDHSKWLWTIINVPLHALSLGVFIHTEKEVTHTHTHTFRRDFGCISSSGCSVFLMDTSNDWTCSKSCQCVLLSFLAIPFTISISQTAWQVYTAWYIFYATPFTIRNRTPFDSKSYLLLNGCLLQQTKAGHTFTF